MSGFALFLRLLEAKLSPPCARGLVSCLEWCGGVWGRTCRHSLYAIRCCLHTRSSSSNPRRHTAASLRRSKHVTLHTLCWGYGWKRGASGMVGGVLFAVHSRARLGDLKEVRSFKLDFSSNSSDEGFIECISLSHKSRTYTQATGLCLYLVAPIKGVGGACWGRTWCRVAQQLGIELCSMPDGAAVLQSPLSSGVLSGRAICATKLMAWLRAVFKGSGLSLEHFTGHSAKTTTLSWMAKANISEATRCVLGHHTPKGTTAVITYARDELRPREGAGDCVP